MSYTYPRDIEEHKSRRMRQAIYASRYRRDRFIGAVIDTETPMVFLDDYLIAGELRIGPLRSVSVQTDSAAAAHPQVGCVEIVAQGGSRLTVEIGNLPVRFGEGNTIVLIKTGLLGVMDPDPGFRPCEAVYAMDTTDQWHIEWLDVWPPIVEYWSLVQGHRQPENRWIAEAILQHHAEVALADGYRIVETVYTRDGRRIAIGVPEGQRHEPLGLDPAETHLAKIIETLEQRGYPCAFHTTEWHYLNGFDEILYRYGTHPTDD